MARQLFKAANQRTLRALKWTHRMPELQRLAVQEGGLQLRIGGKIQLSPQSAADLRSIYGENAELEIREHEMACRQP